MINKNEEKIIQKSLEEWENNISTEHTLSTLSADTQITTPGGFRGVDIDGLNDIPSSMIAVPYLRLIQPSSKKTEMADGKETPWGQFLFSDTQNAFETLNFVLLRAKHELKKVDANGMYVGEDYAGPTRSKAQVTILGITTDTDRLFILSLSVTSFSSFGKLIAKFKNLQVDKSYRFELNLSSEKIENDKGKFAIVNFKINKELDKKELEQMQKVAFEYGLVLDRQEIVGEEV